LRALRPPRARSHEADGDTFSNYLARFAAVNALGNASGSNSNLYYSFNDGPVHFVGVDTEMWSYGATAKEIAAQKAWLEADLAAVDRTATPWVVGFGHKAYWSECPGWCAGGVLAAARAGISPRAPACYPHPRIPLHTPHPTPLSLPASASPLHRSGPHQLDGVL
jgi:hypothetical protein